MNVAFKEAIKDNNWNCFFFHDIDMIPEIDILYKCNDLQPMQYASAISQWNYW